MTNQNAKRLEEIKRAWTVKFEAWLLENYTEKGIEFNAVETAALRTAFFGGVLEGMRRAEQKMRRPAKLVPSAEGEEGGRS